MSEVSIQLLGGAVIRSADDVVTGSAAQRHRVALLAVLVMAGDSGVGREKLIGLLWPESDETRARNLLNQSVHALRRTLGADVILSIGDNLQLNSDRVSSDVAAFEAAVSAGDLESSVELYAGPFLDGFYLPGDREFEHWVEDRRRRLQTTYRQVLENQAEAAEARGNAEAAVHWWHRLAAQDRYSSEAILSLMQALEAAGRRGDAIAQAEVHVAFLSEELRAEPNPSVLALAERMRREPVRHDTVVASDSTQQHEASSSQPVDGDLETETPGEEVAKVRRIPEPAARRSRAKRWLVPVIGLAVIATIAVVWMQAAGRSGMRRAGIAPGSAEANPTSIAVLPFVNMSSDPEQEYFSDGITEELLNLLAKIPELRVTSQSSSFSFKGQNLDIPEIAERLNVAHILEGSVRRAGNQVRITAQLIDTRSDTHLWSESWDRTLDDIFKIQDEIAADVVAQLKVTLLGAAPTAEETDPEAYTLYLQARHLGRPGTAESLEQSIALYEQALEIDPDYAAAWNGLAANYYYQAGIGLRPINEGFQLALEAANRALAIDPKYAPAHARLGRIASVYNRDLAAAARHLERALDLEPTNLYVLGNAASLARDLGRLDEAIALREYVVARDPVNPGRHVGLGLYYNWAARPDEAIASFRTALTLSPGRIGVQYSIGVVLLFKDEPEAALTAMQQESSDWRMIGLALAHAALGQTAESDAALAALIENFDQVWAYHIAYVMAYRGEADRAFEWLDRAVEHNDGALTQLPVEGLFANIHDDPRWLPFLESIGKSPEQLAAIEFDVRLPP